MSGNQCAAHELCAVPRQFTAAEEIQRAVGSEVHLVATDSSCSVVELRVKDTAFELPRSN